MLVRHAGSAAALASATTLSAVGNVVRQIVRSAELVAKRHAGRERLAALFAERKPWSANRAALALLTGRVAVRFDRARVSAAAAISEIVRQIETALWTLRALPAAATLRRGTVRRR